MSPRPKEDLDSHLWPEVCSLFDQCIHLDSHERDCVLDRATKGRPRLRAEVESLLAEAPAAEKLLEEPIVSALLGNLAIPPNPPMSLRKERPRNPLSTEKHLLFSNLLDRVTVPGVLMWLGILTTLGGLILLGRSAFQTSNPTAPRESFDRSRSELKLKEVPLGTLGLIVNRDVKVLVGDRPFIEVSANVKVQLSLPIGQTHVLRFLNERDGIDTVRKLNLVEGQNLEAFIDLSEETPKGTSMH